MSTPHVGTFIEEPPPGTVPVVSPTPTTVPSSEPRRFRLLDHPRYGARMQANPAGLYVFFEEIANARVTAIEDCITAAAQAYVDWAKSDRAASYEDYLEQALTALLNRARSS